MNVEFDNQEIVSVNLLLEPNQEEYPGDTISLEYEKNNSLNALFSVKDLNFNAEFKSTLDRNNNFETIDFNAKSL